MQSRYWFYAIFFGTAIVSAAMIVFELAGWLAECVGYVVAGSLLYLAGFCFGFERPGLTRERVADGDGVFGLASPGAVRGHDGAPGDRAACRMRCPSR
jgi:phosphoribosylaminoimidazole (AIR) synthetase